MTALDYPVDANENRPFAESLYKNGGRDKLVVYDQPMVPNRPSLASLQKDWPSRWASCLGVMASMLSMALTSAITGTKMATARRMALTPFSPGSALMTRTSSPTSSRPDQEAGSIWLRVHSTTAKCVAQTAVILPPGACSLPTRRRVCPSASASSPACGRWLRLPTGLQRTQQHLGTYRGSHREMFMQEANDMGYPIIPFRPAPTFQASAARSSSPMPPSSPPL